MVLPRGRPPDREPVWLGAQRSALASVLGDSAEAAYATRLATGHLATSTLESYGRKFDRFLRFCRERGLQALPASTATCVKFLSHLAQGGTMAPASAAKYLSAINTVHSNVLHVAQGPASGPLIDQVTKGWEMQRARQRPAERTAQRVPLPAAVALQALRRVQADQAAHAGGAGAAGSAASAGSTLPLEDLRALVYLALGFQLMARASTDAALLSADVTVTAEALQLDLQKEKGKDQRAEFRVLKLPVAAVPALAGVVRYWQQRRAAAWGAVPANSPARFPTHVNRAGQLVRLPACSAHFFLLPSDGPAAARAAPSAHCNRWLQRACALLGAVPPTGGLYQSHSLRSGAASAAAAEGVALNRIRFYGGWAVNSGVTVNYINPTVMADEGSQVFFGWLVAGQRLPQRQGSFVDG